MPFVWSLSAAAVVVTRLGQTLPLVGRGVRGFYCSQCGHTGGACRSEHAVVHTWKALQLAALGTVASWR